MNALNDAVMNGLRDALDQLEADSGIGCIVLTGSEKVFAAGADIVAMQNMDFAQAYNYRLHHPQLGATSDLSQTRDCRCIWFCTWRRMRTGHDV